MLFEQIFDHSDPRIAVYRDLKDKDLAKEGSFIVEGKFILETLLTRSHYEISSILIAEDRLLPLADVMNHVAPKVPVYVAAPDVLEKIAGYNVHRGILAAGVIGQTPINLPAYLVGKQKIAILSNIANPDNIGAIFRNAAALGLDGIILDRQCCSPLYRKAIRVSMGAALVLPWLQTDTIEDIFLQLSVADFSIYALSLQSAVKIEDVSFAPRSAFVFGEEAHGLPFGVQSRSQSITIPMANGTDSLNVAATSAIVFDAVRRQTT